MTTTPRKIDKLIVGGILFVLFSLSCSRNEVFFEYEPVSPGGWKTTDTLFFCPKIKDTQAVYDVFIEVRNDNQYLYQNLWLYVSGLNGAETAQPRPIEILLADEFGKWNGKGFSFVYEVSIPYLQGVRFSRHSQSVGDSTMTVAIRHGMDDNPLKGLKNIGLRIVKREE